MVIVLDTSLSVQAYLFDKMKHIWF